MKLKITVESKTYEVEVEVAEPEVHAPPVYSFQSSAAVRVPAAVPHAPVPGANENVNEDKVCRSPIAGIVVKVAAQPGQQIQTGDTLMVLEAMKMETAITAPVSGKIAKINVNQGDAVKGGQILVEFE
ncbi:MAG: biotin/lipoyl-containing protein [Bryobacteraceae bacterium]|nr:biotin/lipoyl-containing protein [Bryobacteraceae bacterium]